MPIRCRHHCLSHYRMSHYQQPVATALLAQVLAQVGVVEVVALT
jgi:hypothetical protein